jgi:predicted acyl esterase
MKKFRAWTLLLCLLVQSLYADLPLPDQTVMIPMRDGTELAADLYFPGPNPENYPCILVRSPSGRRQDYFTSVIGMKQAGFVIAIQDARNATDPEGKTMPYIPDGWGTQQDGYDTVEWMAKSPWCNGKLGTVGWSAMGITQHLMAPTAPPSLLCQYIGMATPTIYHYGSYGGGQLRKNLVEGWLAEHAHHPSVLDLVKAHPKYGPFWEQMNANALSDKVKVAGLHLGGWYDLFLQGTIDAFTARQYDGGEGAKGKQKLVIGPWNHYWPSDQSLAEFSVPEKAQMLPENASLVTWFNYYLKDEGNIDSIPAVTYYVMGPFDGTESSGHVWKTSDTWPIPAENETLYLSRGSLLSQNQLKAVHDTNMYEYDPNNPVPTLGGKHLFLQSGPKDQQDLENRSDLLVFTSEPLEEDLEITGRMSADIYFSSDCDETDLAISFTDVYPDGKSLLVSDGLSHVTGLKDETQLIKIDLLSTSMVFAKGHRFRVTISSANYPSYEKSMNPKKMNNGVVFEGGVARNTVHTGKLTASCVNLPVVKKG